MFVMMYSLCSMKKHDPFVIYYIVEIHVSKITVYIPYIGLIKWNNSSSCITKKIWLSAYFSMT